MSAALHQLGAKGLAIALLEMPIAAYERQRLADRGMLTPAQMAALLGVSTNVLLLRHKKKPMPAHRVNNKGAYMYEPPPNCDGH